MLIFLQIKVCSRVPVCLFVSEYILMQKQIYAYMLADKSLFKSACMSIRK